PGEKNKDRVKNLLQSTAKLEFWKVEANHPQVTSYFSSLNPQSLGIKTDRENLQGITQPPKEGNSIFSVELKDTAIINDILNSDNLKASMPSSIRNFKYFWANKPVLDNEG